MGKKVILFIIFVFIGNGFALPYVQLYQVKQNFEVQGPELNDIDVADFVLGVPSKIKLVFGVSVHNPTHLPFELERMSYSMDVNDRSIGDGFTGHLIIPRETIKSVLLPIELSTTDTIRGVTDAIRSDKFQLTVKGDMEIPIKFYGFVEVFTLSVPFEKTNSVSTLTVSKGALPGN